MKKLILTLLALILLFESNFAQKVEKTHVEKIAQEVYKRNNQGKTTNLKDVVPLGNEGKKDTLLYIVPFEESGFAIISGNLAAPPVLGYCLKGVYDSASMPPGLLYLIEKYKYEIDKLKEEKQKPDESVQKLWEEYLSGIQLKSYTIGTRLLTSAWGQYSNYNQFCPTACPAGCTAVAMAQILRYWECRINPTGIVSYSGSGYYGGSADFGATTYSWRDMNNTSADANNALLIYHAGVSCFTKYKSNGSSSTPGRARDGFVNNWGINSSANVKWRIWHLVPGKMI